jgi:hypothetical protein
MHHRVLWLDKDDHIRGTYDLVECSSDEQAIRLAAVWLEAWPVVEVWQGRTRIATLKAANFRTNGSLDLPAPYWSFSAKHWRERAEEARVIAEGMHDTAAKDALLQAAGAADRMARVGGEYGDGRAAIAGNSSGPAGRDGTVAWKA